MDHSDAVTPPTAQETEQPRSETDRRPAWPQETRGERYNWELTRGPIHAFGESKTLACWSEDPRCTVKREALRMRLALGWDTEDAITRSKRETRPLLFTLDGRTLTLRGWADQSGIKYHTLYDRVTKAGMTFGDAIEKGPTGKDFAVPVTAFGETKTLHRWAVDARANCTAQTLRRRLTTGWNPEQAITEKPQRRPRLGTGTPHDAFGRRMGLEDWARLARIPTGIITKRMQGHTLTLEAALHSLGWTPPANTTSPTADPTPTAEEPRTEDPEQPLAPPSAARSEPAPSAPGSKTSIPQPGTAAAAGSRTIGRASTASPHTARAHHSTPPTPVSRRRP